MFLYKGFGIKEIPHSQIKTIIQCHNLLLFVELQKTANFYHIPWSLKVTENSNLLSSTLYYLLVMKEFDSSDSVCQILLYAQMLSCGLCGAKLRPSKSALTIVSQTEPIFSSSHH